MKSMQWKAGSLVAGAALVCLLVAGGNQSATAQNTRTDTVPKKTEKKVKDLDEALEEVHNAQLELERSLKNIDWKKIELDIQESMKNLDLNMSKMKTDLELSLKEIDAAKIKADVDAAMAKIDWKKIEKEIEKAKEIDLSKIKADLEKIQPELEQTMQQARESIEKAKAELKEYKDFMDGLEKDGLIDKKGTYTIEHRNSQLFINGQLQPQAVYEKYRTFLDKHKKITIKKSPDNFDIEND